EKGLISYTNENKLEGIKQKVLRPKLVGYGVVLRAMILVFIYSSATIAPVRMDIIRDRNHLYRAYNQGLVENTFTLKILNKTEQSHEYTMSVGGLDNYKWYGPTSVTIAGGEVLTLPISVGIDPVELSRSVTNIEIKVKTHIDGEEVEVEQES